MTQFIVITGMSGAGKALAMRHFEDLGFFCVDNLPPALLPMLAELCARGGIGRAAIVADVRAGTFFDDLAGALENLTQQGYPYRILFLDADDDLLTQRFRETRRRHPLSDEFPALRDAIAAEREALAELRARANKIINTSRVVPRELREEIRRAFLDGETEPGLSIRVESFGFKHGAPPDADLLFDVRFLPNPNYDRQIGHLDGTTQPIIDYVMNDSVTQEFLAKWGDFLDFCVPHFEREGKSYLTIAIGCTGGRHRSVALANWLGARLSHNGFRAVVRHRDLERSSSEARNFEGAEGAPKDDAGQGQLFELGATTLDATTTTSPTEAATPPDTVAAQSEIALQNEVSP